MPVMVDLEPVVREIRETTPPEHFVLPATQWVEGERGLVPLECAERPCDVKTIWRTVRRIVAVSVSRSSRTRIPGSHGDRNNQRHEAMIEVPCRRRSLLRPEQGGEPRSSPASLDIGYA